MLNKNQERELAYLVKIDAITSLPGYDKVELAHVGGWTVVVGKGEFKAGDPAVYFEIDSQLPEKPPFSDLAFLASKHFKIKTQKMCKAYSQGLLMSVASFGWVIQADGSVWDPGAGDHGRKDIGAESGFLTKELEVTYAVPEDNKRKAKSADKYKKMAQRHPKLFKTKAIRWLMTKNWGKAFLFFFLGKAKDKKNGWPAWVKKTDEERIENLSYLFKASVDGEKPKWIATEKIDGSSTTFTMKRGKFFKKNEFYVCSRNVVFDKPDKACFYDTNIYLEMAGRYNIEATLTEILKQMPEIEWVTIQGETYGASVQKRDYGMKNRDFMAFNLITSDRGRWNSIEMSTFLSNFGIPCVPILDEAYTLPGNVDELRAYVEKTASKIDGGMREGIVFRSPDGVNSFKCVSPKFLLHYHS
jgi:hypothetical protein